MGEKMGRKVMYADERDIQRHTKPLGVGDAHHQGADEARTVGHTHEPDLLPFHPRAFKGLLHEIWELLQVVPGGQLWDHTPVAGVDVGLGIEDVGENFPSIP